jgi:hypothetical protein
MFFERAPEKVRYKLSDWAGLGGDVGAYLTGHALETAISKMNSALVRCVRADKAAKDGDFVARCTMRTARCSGTTTHPKGRPTPSSRRARDNKEASKLEVGDSSRGKRGGRERRQMARRRLLAKLRCFYKSDATSFDPLVIKQRLLAALAWAQGLSSGPRRLTATDRPRVPCPYHLRQPLAERDARPCG